MRYPQPLQHHVLDAAAHDKLENVRGGAQARPEQRRRKCSCWSPKLFGERPSWVRFVCRDGKSCYHTQACRNFRSCSFVFSFVYVRELFNVFEWVQNIEQPGMRIHIGIYTLRASERIKNCNAVCDALRILMNGRPRLTWLRCIAAFRCDVLHTWDVRNDSQGIDGGCSSADAFAFIRVVIRVGSPLHSSQFLLALCSVIEFWILDLVPNWILDLGYWILRSTNCSQLQQVSSSITKYIRIHDGCRAGS